jgi:chitin synthase
LTKPCIPTCQQLFFINLHIMSSSRHHDDGSSLSSLSHGPSAYNAVEPKPIASANNSVRSKASSRHSNNSPPTLDHGSVAQSYRSNQQGTLRSIDDGRSIHPNDDNSRMGGEEESQSHYSRRSSGGSSRHSGGGGGSRSHRSSNNNDDNEGPDNQSRGGRSGYSSRDPDADRSVRSSQGMAVPPPPRSVGSSSHRGHGRSDPDGMSHEFGADDPDGRHYAPGATSNSSSNNKNNNRAVPVNVNNNSSSSSSSSNAGTPSVAQSRASSRASSSRRSSPPMGNSNNSNNNNYPEPIGEEEEESYYSESKQSRMSRSYYDEQENESIPEENSYYSRESRDNSTRRSGRVPAPPPRISEELAAYSQEDDPTYASRGDYSQDDSKRSYESSVASTKKKRKVKPVPVKEVDNNKRAMWWYNFSRCVTCCVPNGCIRKEDVEAKQAWREKVAICFCVFLASAFFVGLFGFIPVFLCRERTVYTLGNVQERTKEDWVVLNGYVYDVGGLFERHPTGPQGVEAFLHDDASRMFPRLPPIMLPDMCLNKAKFLDNEVLQVTTPTCSDMTNEDLKNGVPCHTFVTGVNATAKYMGEFEKGVLAHDGAVLLDSPFTFWVSIHDRVYNVTKYVNEIRNEQTKQIEKDHPMAYLEPTLNNLVINKLNEDATELFLSVYPDDRVLNCMDELFYVGIIDTRFDVVCFVLNIIMYFLLIFVALIMIAQMVCSLMYIAKGTRTYSDEDTQDQVIIMVPCYNEGASELIKTIDSVLSTTYPEENKVIFIIADGVVTGSGEEMSTPESLAEILGFEMDPHNDELYAYDSIGLLTSNRSRVYHGYYEVEDRSLKYLVVVKHGLPMEQAGSAKPGNRGKRDSQLIVMGYFNRIYHGRELTELDAAIEDGLIDLNMQSDDMRLLMTIDADTRVEELSVTHMTYSMNQNDRILALCGETKVDNKWQSWVTMMQVFEYYNNHHMKKGFESAFGCVTCLPGCFTMYRILNDDGKPLLADDHVYAEYLRNDIDSLHEQNLFHLGEDRMLTTLLLHFFPDMFLSYVPEAQCFTIVPHSLRVLMSQRRRWINSTYHNLLELTKVKTMCGVCCCSMKTVVYLDLIACMILPASTVYAVYLIFLVAAGKTQFSILLLVLYGLIIGVQIVVFIIRSRYDFLFWFVYFTIIGVPVFYFLLPLYAFWHMDDFSWGETRKVAAMKTSFEQPKPAPVAQQDDDSTSSSDDDSYSRDSRSRGSRSRRSIS